MPTVVSPPGLTSPPTPPSRSDPANFAARGDAFLSWLPTAWANLTAAMAWITARTQEVFDSAAATQADRILSQSAQAAIAAQSPQANAAAAAQSAAAAAQSATLAATTNPDALLRLNPRSITSPTAIASAYNAHSTGPLSVAEGITVTISNNATWSIT